MSLRRSSGRILSWLLRAGNVRTGPPRLSLPPVGTIQTTKQSFKNVQFLQVFFEYFFKKKRRNEWIKADAYLKGKIFFKYFISMKLAICSIVTEPLFHL